LRRNAFAANLGKPVIRGTRVTVEAIWRNSRDSADEAVADVTEALEDYFAFVREQGEPVPAPSTDSVEVRYAEVAA
jgi:hypothetical protein